MTPCQRVAAEAGHLKRRCPPLAVSLRRACREHSKRKMLRRCGELRGAPRCACSAAPPPPPRHIRIDLTQIQTAPCVHEAEFARDAGFKERACPPANARAPTDAAPHAAFCAARGPFAPPSADRLQSSRRSPRVHASGHPASMRVALVARQRQTGGKGTVAFSDEPTHARLRRPRALTLTFWSPPPVAKRAPSGERATLKTGVPSWPTHSGLNMRIWQAASRRSPLQGAHRGRPGGAHAGPHCVSGPCGCGADAARARRACGARIKSFHDLVQLLIWSHQWSPVHELMKRPRTPKCWRQITEQGNNTRRTGGLELQARRIIANVLTERAGGWHLDSKRSIALR